MNNPGKKAGAVLFDMDGVLVDSWPVARQAFELACHEVCCAVAPLEAFRCRMGMPLEVILKELALPQAIVPLFHKSSMEFAHKVKCYEGILDVLKFCKDMGFDVGVVTGKNRVRARDIFDRTGIGSYVDMLITPDDAPGKPNPEALRACLKGLCGPQDSALFYVGDSAIDMITARNAGLPAAFAAWGAWQKVPPENYDLYFETPADIINTLSRSTFKKKELEI